MRFKYKALHSYSGIREKLEDIQRSASLSVKEASRTCEPFEVNNRSTNGRFLYREAHNRGATSETCLRECCRHKLEHILSRKDTLSAVVAMNIFQANAEKVEKGRQFSYRKVSCRVEIHREVYGLTLFIGMALITQRSH